MTEPRRVLDGVPREPDDDTFDRAKWKETAIDFNAQLDELWRQQNEIAELVPEEFDDDISQFAIIINYIKHLQSICAPREPECPTNHGALFVGADAGLPYAIRFPGRYKFCPDCGALLKGTE